MRRGVIQNQHRRFVNIPAIILNGGNQKITVDVLWAFIADAEIIRAKDAEQIHLFIALRKNLNPLTSTLPRIRQHRVHRKRAFVAEHQINSARQIKLPQLL